LKTDRAWMVANTAGNMLSSLGTDASAIAHSHGVICAGRGSG
jgi:hypothetical protein